MAATAFLLHHGNIFNYMGQPKRLCLEVYEGGLCVYCFSDGESSTIFLLSNYSNIRVKDALN
jgi:hypothetical protein